MVCGTLPGGGEGQSLEVWLYPLYLLKHELLDKLCIIFAAVARVVGGDPLSTREASTSDMAQSTASSVCVCVCV